MSEREQGLADFMVLLAVVGLGFLTWTSVSEATNVARWKTFLQFIPAVVFALAALTRHLRWALAFRFLTGAWVVVTTFIVSFPDIGLGACANSILGGAVVMASLPWRLALPAAR